MEIPAGRGAFVRGCPGRAVLRWQPLRGGFVPGRIPQSKLLSLLYVSGLVVKLICTETGERTFLLEEEREMKAKGKAVCIKFEL